MIDLLGKLTTRVQKRQSSAADRLLEAARRDAAGESVDLAALEDAFFESRTSLEDFAALVQRERDRKQHLDRFEKLGSLRNKADGLQKEIDRENARFDEIRSKFDSTIVGLHQKHREAQRELDKATQSRDWLVAVENVGGSLGMEYGPAVHARDEAEVAVAGFDNEIRLIRASLDSERGFLKEFAGLSEKELAGVDATTRHRWEQHEKREKRLAARLKETEKQRTEAARDHAAKVRAVEALQKRVLTGK